MKKTWFALVYLTKLYFLVVCRFDCQPAHFYYIILSFPLVLNILCTSFLLIWFTWKLHVSLVCIITVFCQNSYICAVTDFESKQTNKLPFLLITNFLIVSIRCPWCAMLEHGILAWTIKCVQLKPIACQPPGAHFISLLISFAWLIACMSQNERLVTDICVYVCVNVQEYVGGMSYVLITWLLHVVNIISHYATTPFVSMAQYVKVPIVFIWCTLSFLCILYFSLALIILTLDAVFSSHAHSLHVNTRCNQSSCLFGV